MKFLYSYQISNIKRVNQEIIKKDNSFKWHFSINEELSLGETSLSNDEFISLKLILVRHIAKVNYIFDSIDLNQLIIIIKENISIDKSYSIQIINDVDLILNNLMKEINFNLQDYNLNIKNPDQIISVAYFKDKLYLGFSNKILNMSDYKCGKIHYAKDNNTISRSQYKLMEAIHVFDLNLNDYKVAADLGAAPGGWSSVISSYNIPVSSIDPAELDPSLKNNKYITHYKLSTQEFYKKNKTVYDLIVNDMKMEPKKSIDIINKFSSFIKSGGLVIMTLKLYKYYTINDFNYYFSLLSSEYKLINARQLFHNRDEITVVFKKL